MRVLRDGESEANPEPSVAAVGVFDGLHLGHQRVLEQVRQMANAQGAVATVVTFDPHPALTLAPERAPLQLATLDQRIEGMAKLGIEQVRVVTFDDVLAQESARSFVERVLVGELCARDVVVGEDFVFGHSREGNVETLRIEGLSRGFEVHPAPIYGADRRWSSTEVRKALASGDLDAAGAILGRPFALRGLVVHGDARGAQLGFRTANMDLAPRQQLPSMGIYAGAIRMPDHSWWPAAISVGTRPQFYENGDLLVEVHVPGFSGDIYAQAVDVAFLSRLRGETKFADTAELVAQIGADVERTLGIYTKFNPRASALLG
jgi:riboflavin kinase/FMN adenylyltransferase